MIDVMLTLAALSFGFVSGLVKGSIGLGILLGMVAAYQASRRKGRAPWRAVSDGLFFPMTAGILAAEWVMRQEENTDTEATHANFNTATEAEQRRILDALTKIRSLRY